MGRNLASATGLAFQLNADLERSGEMLPPQDRLIIKKFTEYALNKRAAIANAANLMPLEILLLVTLLEEHKDNQRAFDELREEIEELRALPY